MAQLSASADTIKLLGTTGLGGTDAIGYKLYLFHQLNAKIVSYMASTYYIEGNVTDFISGYDYFWISSREAEDKNVVAKISCNYDSNLMMTRLVVLGTAVSGDTFVTKDIDVGAFVCGRYDITDILKDLGVTQQQMVGDNSINESIAAKLNIVINDENRTFYDKMNKTGYFYSKDVITEIVAISAMSQHSVQSGVYTTFIKVKDLTKYYIGGNFINGHLEFLTGEAIGDRTLITDANGNSFNVLGHYSIELTDLREYRKNVKVGDKVRVCKKDTFWFRLDVWHREHIDEKVYVMSGKLDLDSVATSDAERLLSIEGFSTVKDLMNKNVGDLFFDNGLNLPRLNEIKTLYLDKCANKNVKVIQRIEVEPNPLESIEIKQIAFDVGPGWHIFDFNPEGPLFRFDLGTWYQAVDEGSFEKSTQSIFLLSMADSRFTNPAVLPDHTLESNTMEENVQIERTWHGGWCAFTVATEDESTGSINTQRLKSGNAIWKKFVGLPKEPCRMLFYVDEDRKITKQVVYAYSYDNGESKALQAFFDYIEYYRDGSTKWDVTYDLGFGAQAYRTGSELPFSTYPEKLVLCSFKKINGILMRFYNTDSSHNAILSRMLQHLRFKFSNAEETIIGNLSTRYVSGFCSDAPHNKNNFTLEIYEPLDASIDSYYEDIVNKNMWLMSISGPNFGEIKKIKELELLADRSQMEIKIDGNFTSNITQFDRFTIINKQNEVRFIDIGDNMKDGESPDVLALESEDLASGRFYDIKKENINDVLYSGVLLRPDDFVCIGHRHKFYSAVIAIDLNTGTDYQEIAWYLRRDFFDVLYWNGSGWSRASNVSVVPSNLVHLRADADYKIKYRILFDAPNWQVGGYDEADYAAGDAPSNIPDEKMYVMKLKVSSSIPVYIKYVSLSVDAELNLMVTWDNINEWSKSSVDITSGKQIVDTLLPDDLRLSMYAIELDATGFYADLILCRPIEKLRGSLGDDLYVTFDTSNIDESVEKDILIYNPNNINRLSHIPVNMNYQSLMNKILESCGFKFSKDARTSVDHSNDISKDIVNLVGSKYDGKYPIDVGWDKAFVTERLSHNISGEYRHVCVIRDSGTYRAFCVTRDGTEVHMWTSTDCKTWVNQCNIVKNIGTKLIHAIDVVKNKDDENYAFYITAM